MKTIIPRYEDAELKNLPKKCFIVTNSERRDAACPKKHWFRYSRGLVPSQTASVLRMGTAWHHLMDQVHTFWMKHDCSIDEGRTNAMLARYHYELMETVMTGDLTEEDALEQYDKVSRAFNGWFSYRGRDPYKLHRVVAVELPVAGQIVHPTTGKPLRVSGYVVNESDHIRMARAGEYKNAQLVKWPYFQVGKLDTVLQHRRTGAVWVMDHKFTSKVKGYIQNALFDPQLPGYCWMLQENIREGLVDGLEKSDKVAGFMYQVTSSQMQQDPKVLKSGELSQSKTARVPSWRFENKLNQLELDKVIYEDYVMSLKDRVDHTLYRTEWLTINAETHDIYKREIYGEAIKISGLKRNAVRAKSSQDVYETHPRVPICMLPGGMCQFRSPCFNGDEDISFNYEVKSGVRWCSTEGYTQLDQEKNLGF